MAHFKQPLVFDAKLVSHTAPGVRHALKNRRRELVIECSRQGSYIVTIRHARTDFTAELHTPLDLHQLIQIRTSLPWHVRPWVDNWIRLMISPAWPELVDNFGRRWTHPLERIVGAWPELWRHLRYAWPRALARSAFVRDERFRILREKVIVLAVVAILLSSVIAFVIMPLADVFRLAGGIDSGSAPAGPQLLSLRIDVLSVAASLLSSMTLVIALWFTWRSVRATERQLLDQAQVATRANYLTEQGQITDRFANAVEMLAHARPDIVVGGTYALGRIARDSARDHNTVVSVLVAHLRRNALWTPPGPRRYEPRQAILSVLAKRFDGLEAQVAEREPHRLDLAGLDLTGIFVLGGWFRNSILDQAHLEDSVLRGSSFEGASLKSTHLERADLRMCAFGSDIRRQGGSAFSSGTRLEDAHLEGSNLHMATGLNFKTLKDAWIDEWTVPPMLPPPPWWPVLLQASNKRRLSGLGAIRGLLPPRRTK